MDKNGFPKGISLPAPAIGSILILLLATCFLIALIAAGGLWYFAYGLENRPPREQNLNFILNPATIRWNQDGSATIVSESDLDFIAALGFIHASHDPWQMMLWRQTAEGKLTTWFGSSLLQIDRFSRKLRFATLAKATFDNLPSYQQQLLRAYAEGINAALTDERVIHQNEFSILNIEPEPWEPWNALAIERLFLWLSTDVTPLEADSISHRGELAHFLESDRKLRQWLQIHSFHHSNAAVLQTEPQGTAFFYRLAYGSSALPLVQEIRVDSPVYSSQLLATLPGTFIIFSSLSQKSNWAILPHGALTISHAPTPDSSTTSYEKLINRDQSEFLAAFNHYPGKLYISDIDLAKRDSMLEISWSGLRQGTDAFTFLGLLDADSSTFELQSGFGLLQKDSVWTIWGSPSQQHLVQAGAGIVVGSTRWTQFVANHLDSLATVSPDRLNPDEWNDECYSRWAELEMKALTSYFFPLPNFQDPAYFDALTYLRNWDYSFSSSSIGASIFVDTIERLGVADSTSTRDSLSIFEAFEQTVDELSQRYGSDLSRWRFEVTHPERRYYPVWETDSIFSAASTPLSSSRFAALRLAGKGHPSTLCWGSLGTGESLSLSAKWEARSLGIDGDRVISWNKHAIPDGFLDRYLIENRPTTTHELDSRDPGKIRTTRLTPRAQ